MSVPTNDGGPAFPLQSIGPDFQPGHCGMSLRDWFAGQALVGDLSSQSVEVGYYSGENWHKNAAESAYRLADAMVAARSKKEDAP